MGNPIHAVLEADAVDIVLAIAGGHATKIHVKAENDVARLKIDAAEHATGKAIEVTIEIKVAILDTDIGRG
jgi:HSP20 family molecular chaperone IbpA